MNNNNNNYLEHHGVKGQKWGIRRYQNYDGSYTKRGMSRYNKKLEAYQKADERYQKAKKSKSSKSELTQARLNRRVTKRQLNKAYAHLKHDKAADKGKEHYSKGETIRSNRAKNVRINAGLAAASVVAKYAAMKYGNSRSDRAKPATIAIIAANATVSVASLATYYKTIQHNKEIREYYNHTSK